MIKFNISENYKKKRLPPALKESFFFGIKEYNEQ